MSVQPPTNDRFRFADADAASSVSKVFLSLDKSTLDVVNRCVIVWDRREGLSFVLHLPCPHSPGKGLFLE